MGLAEVRLKCVKECVVLGDKLIIHDEVGLAGWNVLLSDLLNRESALWGGVDEGEVTLVVGEDDNFVHRVTLAEDGDGRISVVSVSARG